MQDLQKNKEENPLVKHMVLHHPGDTPEFKISLDRVWKPYMGRQIGEALKIASSNPSLLMNSKAEWGGIKSAESPLA